jgi:asparagine synthetase B (glutamine-hydrolysing)
MPDFVVRFGSPASAEIVSNLEFLGRNRLGHNSCSVRQGDGYQLMSLEDARRLQFYEGDEGWILVKGIIFECNADRAASLKSIFHALTEKGKSINSYEGAFCLALWDKRSKTGLALNDQASALNLYYLETPGGTFVATNALLLAKSVGVGLSPQGVAEFLARGVLLAPRTMFEGISRLSIGEHLTFKQETATIGRHWSAYADYRIRPREVV